MYETNNLNINNGIFQGDSLSLLPFCIALIPLSIEVKNTHDRHKTALKNSHLFYIDDLKLYAKNNDDLDGLLSIVKRFSDDKGIQIWSGQMCERQI